MTNDLSMQELLDQQEQELSKVKVGQTITGKIIRVNNEGLFLDLNYGFDGIIKIEELNLPKGKYASEVYNVGDEVTAIITKVYHKDGVVQLSKLKLDAKNDFAELEKAYNEHRIITVNVIKNIERGVFASYKTTDLFIPISQLDTKFVQDTKGYVGKNLEVYIKELDTKKNRFVATHRDVLQERLDKEREERRIRIQEEKQVAKAKAKAEKEAHIAKVKSEKETLFNSLEAGQKREGKVTKIMPYGAFVDIGGLEGLVHLNNLSWERVEKVEDMLSEGQEVEVYVLDVDQETKKVALALKDINNDPWELIAKEIQVEDIVTGKVVRTIEKGAIVELREGVQAFLPISELSEERVVKVTSVVNVGEEISAMIIEFKPKNRRLILSIKEATREPEEDYSQFLEVEESLGSLGDLFKDKFKKLQK
ncbi:30S ribosomal protein S1 [Romboutsia sp.]|uniref:30S ribosomal protein S1 n=1 Tax=Romboutsia sp. TaxID=1965302 RepID=UPI003F3D09C7